MNKRLPIGSVMIDISATELSQYDKEKIAHPNTGGVILFTRNYETPKQVAELARTIKATRKGEILIAVDQEGGRVQRFKDGFTCLPPAAVYVEQPEITESAGWLMAAELLVLGIDFSFAPVLDVDYGVSDIIGNRSFSSNSSRVYQLANDFRKGMNNAGMSAVGKHFPGHGAVTLDSHLDLPVDNRSYEMLLEKDILPFKHLISKGLEGVMPAHIVYKEIDELPVGFSPRWIKDILRQQLGFKGAVFTDDLSMQGAVIIGDFVERAAAAVAAGCDMMLMCNNESAAEQVLESMSIKLHREREQRLLNMLSKTTLTHQTLKNSHQWQTISTKIKTLMDLYVD